MKTDGHIKKVNSVVGRTHKTSGSKSKSNSFPTLQAEKLKQIINQPQEITLTPKSGKPGTIIKLSTNSVLISPQIQFGPVIVQGELNDTHQAVFFQCPPRKFGETVPVSVENSHTTALWIYEDETDKTTSMAECKQTIHFD